MAQKVKLSLNGVTSYPITIAQAVAVIGKSKTLDAVLSDLESLAGVTYSIEKDSSGLVYTLKDSQGNPKGTINIPQDTFLDSASFSAETKKLTLTFNTASGKEAISVDMSSLVDTYTAGNGIAISNHVVSAKVDSASESYLTVGTAGLKVSGINSALAGKAALNDFNTLKAAVGANNDAASATGSAFARIAQNKADLASHVADSVKHITASERNAWNAKVDATVVGDATYEEVDSIIG